MHHLKSGSCRATGARWLGLVLLLGGATLQAATFTVNSTADSGAGSLRQALSDANSTPGADLIQFAIPGAGPHTLAPLSALPALTDNAGVTLNGYTQSGALANAGATGAETTAALMLVLDGSGAGNVAGLSIASANNLVQGLVIRSFAGAGIEILGAGATGNSIRGCFIGTDASGTLNYPNGTGVWIGSGASNNLVGGGGAHLNLIAGNQGAGVQVTGGSGNTIQRNHIRDNGGLGIDLDAGGVTFNDCDDLDAGPNGLQNFPVLNAAQVNPDGSLEASGIVETESGTVTLELYAVGETLDPTFHGEGARYIASTTPGNGQWTLTVPAAIVQAAGLQETNAFLAATATRAGSTSEFSNVRLLWHAPLAHSQMLGALPGQPRPFTLTGSDLENDALEFRVDTQPLQGTLSGVAPNLTYLPAADFIGMDSFTFHVEDHCQASDPQTIHFYVAGPALCGRIYFQSDRDGNWEIYRMRPDGSGLVNLTQHAAQDLQPRVSPDGLRVAFYSNRDNAQFELYVMDCNGGTLQRVTQGTGLDLNLYPAGLAWSNGGTQLYFCANSPRALYRVNLDGSGLTQLHFQAGLDCYAPDCSPDGQKLALTRNTTGDGTSAEIYTLNASGGGLLQLTDSSGANHNQFGGWSRNGQVLLYSAWRTCFGGEKELQLMKSDGSGSKPFTSLGADTLWPRWGPGDARIVCASNRDGNYEIYRVNLDGSGALRLTNQGSQDTAPDWGTIAPQATPLTLCALQNGTRAITLGGTDADGDGLSPLVLTLPASGTLTGSGANRVYTPNPDFVGNDSFTYYVCDGAKGSAPVTVSIYVARSTEPGRIYFQSDRDGNCEIYSMRPDGSDLRNLSTHAAQDQAPRCSPDGSRVAFYSNRDNPNYELYLMDAAGGNLARVTTNTGLDLNFFPGGLCWSPDGTRLYFATNAPRGLYRVNLDGSNLIQIHAQGGKDLYAPDLSGDGNQLLFTKNDTGDGLSAEVCTALADGSAVTARTSSPGNDHAQCGVWNRNASVVLLDWARAEFGGGKELMLMRPDGQAPTRLGSLGSDTLWPRWSPTNSRIVCASNRDGNYELYKIASDGTGLLRLTTHAATDTSPDWGNAAPGAEDLTCGVQRNIARPIQLRAADRDGDPLTWEVLTPPSHGTLSGNAPNLTYTPVTDYTGTDSFTYRARDGALDSPAATVFLYVAPVHSCGRIYFQSNRSGNNEIYAMRSNGSGLANLTNHAADDRMPRVSPDGTQLAFLSNRNRAQYDLFLVQTDGTNLRCLATGLDLDFEGQLAWSPNGAQLYLCPNSPRGLYRIDASGANLVQLLNSGLDVYSPDASPTGSVLTITQNTPGNGYSAEVYTLAPNGTGVTPITQISGGQNHNQCGAWSNDGSVLLFDSFRDTFGGTKELLLMRPNGAGQTAFTALGGLDKDHSAPRFSASDHQIVFQSNRDGNYELYRVNLDGTGLLRLTNDGAADRFPDWGNAAPLAQPDAYTTLQNRQLAVTAPGCLANDRDGDGDPLSAQLLSNPTHGSLVFSPDGSFVYSPHTGYLGADSFTYQICDGALASAPATVQLTVLKPDLGPPIARNDAYSVNEDNDLTVDRTRGVLFNDSDPDGQALSAQLLTQTTHGTLTFNADGTFVYRPAPNYNGPDGFTYRAQTPGEYTNAATVTITVVAINDPPVAVLNASPMVIATGQATFLDGSQSSDPEGEALTYEWNFGDGAHGTPATTIHTFTASGKYTVTLTVRDPKGRFDQEQVEILVVDYVPPSSNNPPRAFLGVTVKTGETQHEVHLDASESTDSDGRVTYYRWDFEDGSTMLGPKVVKTVLTEGILRGSLTLYDDAGASTVVDFRVLVLKNITDQDGDVGGGDGTPGQPVLSWFKYKSVFDKPNLDQVMFKISNFEATPGDRLSVMVGQNRWGAIFQEGDELEEITLDDKMSHKDAPGAGEVVQVRITPTGQMTFKAVRSEFIDRLDYRPADEATSTSGIQTIPVQIIRIKPDNSKVRYNFFVPVSYTVKVRNQDEEFTIFGNLNTTATPRNP